MRSTGCGASISARPSPPPPRCRWCGLPPIRAVWSRSMRWRWWTEVSQDRNQMSLTHAQSRPHGEERRSASALRRVSKHAATAPADRRPSRRIAPCGAMLPRTRALLTASLLLCFMFSALQSLLAQGLPSPLSGIISSERDGVMEGVIVSARRAGSTITVSVVSDANGAYSFPAGRLDPGHYELRIRAAGYALDGPGTIELASGQTATADLRLKPAARPASEITNAEWLASAPGDFEIKRLLLNCTDCHSLQRIFESRHSPADFLKVFERMGGYYPGASDLQPQRLTGDHRRPAVPAGMEHKLADYLASINLFGRAEHSFDISTFPRPTGRATRVVITEYALPRREFQPHDVIVDPDGMVWYSHFGEQLLSRLDPRTGATTDFAIPVQKPASPKGTLDLELDQDGNIWVGLMYQTGMAKFDRKSGSFHIYPIPADWQKDATQQSHFSVAATKIDGKAWVKNTDGSQVYRLDVATGAYENLGSFRDHENRPIAIYGIYADHEN